jgi:hypothetical protein
VIHPASYDPTIYRGKRLKIELLAIRAERECPQNPTRELADRLDLACLDEYNLRHARDLARWAGAPKVGRTHREAIEALAGAWVRYRALRRSAALSRRCAARVRALELKMRAHAEGRSPRAQRAAEERDREIVAISMEARSPGFRAHGRDVIAAFAGRAAPARRFTMFAAGAVA